MTIPFENRFKRKPIKFLDIHAEQTNSSESISKFAARWGIRFDNFLLLIVSLGLLVVNYIPNLQTNKLANTCLQIMTILYVFYLNMTKFYEMYKTKSRFDDQKFGYLKVAGLYFLGLISSVFSLLLIKDPTYSNILKALGLAIFPHNLIGLLFKKELTLGDFIYNTIYAVMLGLGDIFGTMGFNTLGLFTLGTFLVKSMQQFCSKSARKINDWQRKITYILATGCVAVFYYYTMNENVLKLPNFDFRRLFTAAN